VYICSPNNPTGNQIEKWKIVEIINELHDKLIIIDEAYVEFASYSISYEIMKNNNVIVLRTLSKAFGLAGARLGYCISNEKFSNLFRKVIQSPYPINTLSLSIGTEILKNADYINDTVKRIKEERDRVYAYLKELENEIRVFKSDANFIFVQIKDIEKYYHILGSLKKEKIIIKALGKIKGRNGGHMRVTIGTKEMNDRFLLALTKSL
jgi:histidinol-phosphate aminotransferase